VELGTNVGVRRQYDLLPDHFGHHTSVRNAVMFCDVTVAAVAATMSASAAAGYSKHRAPKAQELQRERAPKVRQRAPKARELQRD